MPRLGGLEALAEMRKSVPQLRAIIMSGFSVEEVSKDSQLPLDGFIQKPFSAAELLAVIRRALES